VGCYYNDYRRTWNIGFVHSGDYFEYVISVPSSRTYMTKYHMASNKGGSDGFVLSVEGYTIANQVVSDTTGWRVWNTTTSSVDLSLPAGSHTLRFTANGGGGFNIDWFELF
jgi:hypothetical protein